MLTDPQWRMLEWAARPEGSGLYLNLNTMSALICRGLADFAVVEDKTVLKATKLGRQYLSLKSDFSMSPDFFQAREEAKELRGRK
jgi:hypothetical protein